MNEFLTVVGALTLLFLTGFLIMCIISAINQWIDRLKRNYQYKHRFDKPPTAKCYCIDCHHHNNETNQCYRFGETTGEYRCTADNWFCWEARPREEK